MSSTPGSSLDAARAILVVDDEPQIRRAVKNALRGTADRVLEAVTGSQALDLAATERPELVVLDLGLPDMAGLDVCTELRRWATMPIVVLSARHAEDEKVRLLNAGADDYITKPFSLLEFAARVQAQLRRARTPPDPVGPALETGDGLSIDFRARTVSRRGKPIRVTPLEWEILCALAREPGRTLTHQQIFNAVWGRQFGNPKQYLRVHITNLRRKIELDSSRPQAIITEPGVGYRFEAASR
ncbi:MAG TPA: response regulator transcription factor [Gemmatimonadales bacterium]|jgi:two-component system KDP operon response regulator KdpE|nr:response regulator transcription factor [Gemmatimonadales bacterium]